MTTNTKKVTSSLIIGIIMLTPILAMAYTTPSQPTVLGSIDIMIGNILTLLWQLFMGLAVIMFLIAGFFFITANGEPDKLKTARSALIWGVIGVIVATLSYSIPWIVSKIVNP